MHNSGYTEYTYDAMGRTVSVKQPPNSGATGSSGTTTYAWTGNELRVTDPKGHYKKYYYDAFGNLYWVTEQRPAGGEYGTAYGYDLLNHLTSVGRGHDSVWQGRTFEYNAQQRLWKVTMPESGITTYEYNTDGTLQRKTFANGNKVEYQYDTWKRPTKINRFMAGSATADVCQSVTLQYD